MCVRVLAFPRMQYFIIDTFIDFHNICLKCLLTIRADIRFQWLSPLGQCHSNGLENEIDITSRISDRIFANLQNVAHFEEKLQ